MVDLYGFHAGTYTIVPWMVVIFNLGIVQLRECFAIDSNAFIMVLELCEGETLDMRLKMHGPMPEKEAKSIIVQILSLGSNGSDVVILCNK